MHEIIKIKWWNSRCPASAVKDVVKTADFVSEHYGGDGVVRDFIEWIVNSKE